MILLAFAFYMFQGTFEELVFRSFMMPNFSKVFGDTWSIILTSILFALVHIGNPNMGVLPMLNLILFGAIFAVAYYKTGSIWICGIAHGMWNFTMGHIYGAEVSGTSVLASVFRSTAVSGKELLSGGSFGFEGGIVASIVGTLFLLA